jgi:hypothetical protein
VQLTFRPIEKWPRALTKNRKRSPFSATYNQTFKLLEAELNHLGARNIALQIALRPEDIRLDGQPRANAKPAAHPGVILSFEKFVWSGKYNERGQRMGKYAPYSMPCDAFTDWESNLRAIALSLEALRKVDRYGVTQSGEQYTGWAALPVASNSGECEMAAQFMSEHSGVMLAPHNTDADALKRAYRIAASRLHPDAPGGSNELFVRLKQAYEVLSEKTS